MTQLKTSNLTDQVAAALSSRIAEGKLAAGSRLPTEQELTLEFGVSRTVVREAISRLKSEGLIETRQGAGAFVATSQLRVPFRIVFDTTVSPDTTAEILELRLAVGAEAAAMAAERADRKRLTAIRKALRAIDAALARGGDAFEEDMRFHRCIVEAAGNRQYIELARFLELHARHQIQLTGGSNARIQRMGQSQQAHEKIYQAIAARDPDSARKHAREHFRKGIERTRKAALQQPGRRKSGRVVE